MAQPVKAFFSPEVTLSFITTQLCCQKMIMKITQKPYQSSWKWPCLHCVKYMSEFASQDYERDRYVAIFRTWHFPKPRNRSGSISKLSPFTQKMIRTCLFASSIYWYSLLQPLLFFLLPFIFFNKLFFIFHDI